MRLRGWNIVLIVLSLVSPSCLQFTLTTGRISTDDFRLVGGSALNEGRLQIRHPPDGSWSTVCTDVSAIDDAIAFALCARVGYQLACEYGAGDEFGSAGPIADLGPIEEVIFGACELGPTFTEQDCEITGFPSGSDACPPNSQDFWLHCASGPGDLELRLAYPLSHYTGTVQARCRGTQAWSSVCSTSSWDRRDAEVACRHLGFSFVAERAVTSSSKLDPASIPARVVISEFGCAGNETDLLQCGLGLTRSSCTVFPRLSCGIETTKYGPDVGLCGNRHLCGPNCTQQRDTTNFPRSNCHCDDACVVFGDCCYDYQANCNPESRDPPTSLNGLPIGWYDCVDVPGFDTTFDGYYLVQICPDSWYGSEVRELCELPANDSDVFRSIPVYNNATFAQYKNIYCALCHGESHEEVISWTVEARYSRHGAGAPFLPNFGLGPPGLGGVYTGKFVVSTPELPGVDLRRCSVPAIDTCLEEYRGSETERGCKEFAASVMYRPSAFSGSITNYRNAYCSRCNNLALTLGDSCDYDYCEDVCGEGPWSRCNRRCASPEGFLTIDVLFNFRSEGSSMTGTVSCATGEVYDPFLGSCRLLSCSPGYEVKGGECVKIVAPPTIKPDQPDVGGAFAYNPNNTVNVELVDCLRSLFGQKSQSIVYWDATVDNSSLTRTVNLLAGNETAVDDLNSALSRLANSSWCNVTQVAFFLEFMSVLPVAYCLEFTATGLSLFEGYFGSDNTTKVTRVSQFDYDTSVGVYNLSAIDIVCLGSNLTCPSIVTLTSTDISMFENGNETVVVYMHSGLVLPVGSYVILADGSVVVCSDVVIVTPTPGPPTATELAYRYLYLVLTILSLMALLVTFVVYTLLPALRNLAGLCIMNFVVALFLANLLLLLNGFFVEVPALCLVAAPLIHLTWLAAFMWMLTLSLNVARTITSKVIDKSKASATRPLLLYMLFAWGTSLVIVCVCIALHFCQCAGSGPIYASEISCYIVNSKVNLYAFGVPVALTLTISICLFVFTVVNLRISRSSTRMARNETRIQEAKVEFVIYVRLSVLMGVSWIFGFLTQVVQGYAMLFIFVILNSLQGFLIFLSFCFTARVRGLLAERFGGGCRSPKRQKTRRRAAAHLDTGDTHSQTNPSHTANTYTTKL
ncbi:uncharacterized protein LOC119724728 [Patiria miniata]|uniref:Uncharacterized protein n=1 Tax=Patiria miniata TaxID=46514 RepID=A0A913ZKK0_PATMI|nr:uncharacterized protein LOC119724728 [Patiria miniata]XP_038051844.1 uncharacterized protein LOC119724728 [Patiria miniata]